jgi:multidrug efflux pump subunit AcrB
MLVVGFRLIQTTPLDVFPEFSPLLVEIQTEAPGLSTSEVESLVSTPIENAVNGVKGLKTLRSKSVLGLSSVVLIFDENAELMAARQLVQERLLTLAGQLPALARTPVIRTVHRTRVVISVCDSVFDQTPIFSTRLVDDRPGHEIEHPMAACVELALRKRSKDTAVVAFPGIPDGSPNYS